MLLDGDVSVIMHLTEFETAARYGMPLLIVILNNEALGAEYYKLDAKKMDVKTSQVNTPDLRAVAVAKDGKGRLVRNLDDLRSAAKEWVADPCPMIIDLRISRTVISIPYRRVYYGRED